MASAWIATPDGLAEVPESRGVCRKRVHRWQPGGL